MKYLAILILAATICGCSHFEMVMPNGTVIRHTRFFDDQQLAEVQLATADGFSGSIGKADNAGKVDIETLLSLMRSLGVMK